MSNINWETIKEYEDITFKVADGVARIAFNRPEVRNAFRPKTVDELLDALNVERQYRAREVMLELAQKGIKKIGKERIIDLEKNNDDIDYDQIMSMYQDLLRKDRSGPHSHC